MSDSPVDRLLRWEQGDTPGPWYAAIYPTNRCNLRCSICWQRRFDSLDYSDEVPDERRLALVGNAPTSVSGNGRRFIYYVIQESQEANHDDIRGYQT